MTVAENAATKPVYMSLSVSQKCLTFRVSSNFDFNALILIFFDL